MGEYEIQVCDSFGREKLTQGDMGADLQRRGTEHTGLQGAG